MAARTRRVIVPKKPVYEKATITLPVETLAFARRAWRFYKTRSGGYASGYSEMIADLLERVRARQEK